MKIKSIKIDKMLPPKDDLISKLDKIDFELKEKDCVIITSKVISIDEGNCILDDGSFNKDDFVKKESDLYLESKIEGAYNLSIKNNALLLCAGIDESNANGYYVLLPKDSMVSAKRLWEYFKNRFSLNELGVVITDSHTMPFRYGTLGISLGWWGFKPATFFKEKTDLFDRPFKYTRINVADSLSVAGVFLMGETDEQTPIAIASDIPHIEFTDKTSSDDLLIPYKEDLYYELLRPFFDGE